MQKTQSPTKTALKPYPPIYQTGDMPAMGYTPPPTTAPTQPPTRPPTATPPWTGS